MPYSAMRPRRAKAVVNFARAAAKRTSQCRAWTRPTPAQPPLMAATSGLSMRRATSTGIRAVGQRQVARDRGGAGQVGTRAERLARHRSRRRPRRSVVGRLEQPGEVGDLQVADHAVVAFGPVATSRGPPRHAPRTSTAPHSWGHPRRSGPHPGPRQRQQPRPRPRPRSRGTGWMAAPCSLAIRPVRGAPKTAGDRPGAVPCRSPVRSVQLWPVVAATRRGRGGGACRAWRPCTRRRRRSPRR